MTNISKIPKDKSFESSLAVLMEGYNFIRNRCRRYGTDIFESRVMLEKVICMTGEEAARIFYEPERFDRTAAIPESRFVMTDVRKRPALQRFERVTRGLGEGDLSRLQL
jgi:hypothetical protein